MQTGCARVIPLWLTVVRQGRCIHEVIAYGDKNNRSYASEEGKQSLSLSLSQRDGGEDGRVSIG